MKSSILKPAKPLFLIFVFLFLVSIIINAQEKPILVWHCNTAENVTIDQISKLAVLSTSDTTLKIINVFIHIIRRSDGTGGLTNDQVNSWMTLFRNDYCVHKILINETGRSNLNNTNFYDEMTDAKFPSLINTDVHYNAIDIYLLSPSETYANASGIPGTAVAVGGSFLGTSVLSHEVGHCLGLFHTHCGRGCRDYLNCAESIDGSNCSTCGDLICDTPADPCLSGNVTPNCIYIGDPSFSPDVHNIMSYAPPSCLNHLTVGQTMRIHATIFNNQYIFYERSPEPYISGPGSNVVCASGASFSVENLVTGCYVSCWNQSSNLELYSTNGNSAIFKAKAGASGWGWVVATVSAGSCGSVTLSQYSIWVGPPQVTNQKVDGSSYYPGKQICPGNHWLTVTPVGTGAGNASWTVPPGIQYIVGTNMLDFTFPYSWSSISISARSANSCGNSTNANFYLTKKTYGCGGYFSMYPNPTSDEVTITINEPETIVSKHAEITEAVVSEVIPTDQITYTIRIYNSLGTLVSSSIRTGTSFKIPLTNLRDGTYIVELSDGKNSYREPLIIKHD